MDKWLLKLVRLCNGLFRRQGIDTDRMYAIVETKLMMDKRRVYMNWRPNQQQETRNHLTVVLLIYGFFGVFAGMTVLFLPFLAGMTVVHTYFVFMMAMTLITDFSTVLLDTADNQILLPRPVNSRTFFMARAIHILLYLLQFTFALAVLPAIFTFLKYGILTGLGFCVTTLLSILVAVFFTYFLYMLVLRFGSEEKIRDIVTFFQVGMTILFAVGTQLLPRIIDMSAVAEFEIHWYSWFLPPVWMAVMLEGIHTLTFDSVHLGITAAALFIPVLLFWLMNKYFAPAFTRKLAAMNTDGARPAGPVTRKRNDGFVTVLSRIFSRQPVEKGAFEFTWKMTARDKSFKLQFYPGMAYIAFFIFVVIFKSGRNFEEQWASLPATGKYLPLIYMPLLSVSGGIIISAFNENFQASWIYYSTPVAHPGEIILGSLKALFIKFFIPVYLLLFAFCLYVWGIPVIDDFVFGLLSNASCFLAIAFFSQHYLPFSRPPGVKQQTGRFANVFLQLFLIAALVGVHYLVEGNTWIMYAMGILVMLTGWSLLKSLKRVPWQKISI